MLRDQIGTVSMLRLFMQRSCHEVCMARHVSATTLWAAKRRMCKVCTLAYFAQVAIAYPAAAASEDSAGTVISYHILSESLKGNSAIQTLTATPAVQLAKPYWVDNPDRRKPRLALAGVVVLSLATTGVSVAFNFLGRDFFNALSAKQEAEFYTQLAKYLAGFAIGIPVFVFRDYFVVRSPCQLPLWC